MFVNSKNKAVKLMDAEQITTLFARSKEAWGVHEFASCRFQDLPFSEEVRKMCEMNSCGMYGKSWLCPPGCGPIEVWQKKLSAFSHFFLFSTVGRLEDSFDFEGMMAAKENHEKASAAILAELHKQDPAVCALSAGGCSKCTSCTYPDAPCRFEGKLFPSIEACGISVYELTQKLGMKYINGENTVTYFTLLLLP